MSPGPILIAGAGAAGLSLAVHLLKQGSKREMVLIEPRERYADDRTWCYWRFGTHPFEEQVSHRWSRWRLRANGRKILSGSRLHPYCHVRSVDFYRAALRRLRAAPNVRLELGARVLDARPRPQGGVRAETTVGALDGQFLFDSRPQPATGGLVQHFAGVFVRAESPVFDPETPDLMDFDPPEPVVISTESGDSASTSSSPGVHFIYVLPFSPREALVESTLLTPYAGFEASPELVDGHERAVLAYLERRYPGADATVMRRESGAIPMSIPRPNAEDSAIVRIGNAAGCARASSGYAFDAIQRTSGALATAVQRGEAPGRVRVWRRRARWLDRIFLSFLEHRSELAPAVFAALFERLPGEVMPRFLSDRESMAEALRLMSVMPTGVFSREWLRVQTAPSAP